jgi:hypothetical protein
MRINCKLLATNLAFGQQPPSAVSQRRRGMSPAVTVKGARVSMAIADLDYVRTVSDYFYR